MSSQRISVIGLGEVGTPTFEDLSKKLGRTHEIVGVDINSDRLEALTRESHGYHLAQKAPVSDVYIIATYLTDQVKSVLGKLDTSRKPLVSIESTIDPRQTAYFAEWSEETGADVVTVPHRFVPQDTKHRVFNLNRVLGGIDSKATERGVDFYKPLMEMRTDINPPVLAEILVSQEAGTKSFEYAALSKLIDNASRFAPILWAQNLRMALERRGYNFQELRRLSNSKFNINIMDARDGIKLKCLPKDLRILAEHLGDSHMYDMLEQNEQYKTYAKENNFPQTPDL